MATETPTTRLGAVEAPTPLETSFIALLGALAEHIRAEQAVDRTDLADAACDRVLDAAEEARLALYEVLANITTLSATTAATVPLRRMALIMAILVRDGRASAFARYLDHQSEFATYLAVSGDGPTEARVGKMIAAADKRIRIMTRLKLYRQDGVAHEAEAELVAA